jgi:hypothetical protein
MHRKKRGLVIAAVTTLFSFFSVAYISCSKSTSNNPLSCDGVGMYCENGSSCYQGQCVCPRGYEGKYCEVASASKYAGTWDVKQSITGSDSLKAIKDTTYQLTLKSSPTPTTFLLDNFAGNPNYNNIICTIDSINSYKFAVDTLTPFHMLYNQVRILQGATGTIQSDDSKITMNLVVRHLTYTSNWQKDTMTLTLTPHK